MSVNFLVYIVLTLLFCGLLAALAYVKFKTLMFDNLNDFKNNLLDSLNNYRQQIDDRQIQNLKLLQDTLLQGMQTLQSHMAETLSRHTQQVTQDLEKLIQTTNERLKEINGQVEKRLTEGFEKTTATFSDIVKRLALIDDAQKRLVELSGNVVSLQEILIDKRSRGAFGEVQLKNIIQNVLPTQHFSFQHTLSNGNRADCILFLPDPTGNIVIDAKFPLENFQKMTDFSISEIEKKQAQQQFRQDIKKHISDISQKYIMAGETTEGAVMFIPAEAVFAEIHGHFPDLVEVAHRANVWLASPTTMMAILSTARSVIKESMTKQHVKIIQEHLRMLADDFSRFRERMDKLEKHIDQAQEDVKLVNTSAKKISHRFLQIEKGEVTVPETTVS